MKKRKQTTLLLAIAFCGLTGLQGFSKNTKASNKPITEQDKQYAQCLKEKGVTMYGTSWCPHCKEQKKEFGELFSYINYVDCDENPKVCKENHITGYPTLLLPNGKEVEAGSITEVAEASGCSLAQESGSTPSTNELNGKTTEADTSNMSNSETNNSQTQSSITDKTEDTNTQANSQVTSTTTKETIAKPAKDKKQAVAKKKVKNIKANKQTVQTNTSDQ